MDNIKFRKKLKRYNLPYHARELTFSCYKRYHYFDDSIACMIFLDLLYNARIKYNFELWAYVIMLNHVHLIIYPVHEGHIVPKALHTIKGKTGREYKNHLIFQTPEIFDYFCIEKRGKKKFQFWQPGGGYDRNLWSAKAIHSAIEYIENNPVRAGLVSSSEEWRWSSAWARKHQCGLIPDDFSIPILMK
jgi:putative transposase